MGLTSALDLATLTSWNMLTDYTANTHVFIATARAVYHTLQNQSSGASISPSDLELPLMVALQMITVFKRICLSKSHASPALYGVFSSALARYIIDQAWSEIIRP